jgi:hypothetical protein
MTCTNEMQQAEMEFKNFISHNFERPPLVVISIKSGFMCGNYAHGAV